MRCRTIQRSSSKPKTIRLPSRRNVRTRLPWSVSSGGVTERSRNGLASRTLSSRFPPT